LLIASACGVIIYNAVSAAPRSNSINESGISSHPANLDEGIRQTDRNFLNDLARENNQDDPGDGKHLPDPDRDAVKAVTIVENIRTVPSPEAIENLGNQRQRRQKEAGMQPERKVAHRPHWR
jgi:hypothetical protein